MKHDRLLPALVLGLGLTVAVLAVLSKLGHTASPNPGTLNVAPACSGIPNCHTSIQSALYAANDADTIRVAQDLYTETVVITKTVSLEGGWNDDFTVWNRTAHTTTVDAQRRGPVIRVEGSVSPTIEGFVITGGDDTNGEGAGGGIRITQAGLVTIRYNVITDNVACQSSACHGEGGGIAVFSTTVLIENNTIISNTAHSGDSGGGDGGGVYIIGSNNATLARNRILSNTATLTGTGRGGGVYAAGLGFVHNNQIQGNLASVKGDGSGGGVYATPIQDVWQNTIIENVAGRGGGVYLGLSNDKQRLRENLLARNRATAGPGQTNGGGGLVSLANGADIVSNTIKSNTATHFGGGLLLVNASEYTAQYNSFDENIAAFGGGVFVHSSSGTIAHNWVISNTAVSRGGGIYLYAGSSPMVDANRILSNTVTAGPGGGISIRNNAVPVTLTNQIIAYNSALKDGAGLHISSASAIRFINNTVVNNNQGSNQEGVAVLENAQKITVTNNIIAGHRVAVAVSANSTATLDYNSYYDNLVHIVGVSWGPNHRIDDPQFQDRAAGDFRLQAASPLVDVGDNRVAVQRDFEDDPRPMGEGVDIGADEVKNHVYLPLLIRAGFVGL